MRNRPEKTEAPAPDRAAAGAVQFSEAFGLLRRPSRSAAAGRSKQNVISAARTSVAAQKIAAYCHCHAACHGSEDADCGHAYASGPPSG